MLKHLYIKNFTLIEELDIQFNTGFSVITGETGAGKSIILGAIGLLLGQRAESKQIKNGAGKCTIEAHFDISRYDLKNFFADNDIDYDADDCILRRELTANGKSRAFINDTPVALTMLKALGSQLIDIHSQHQNLLLQKEDFQLNVIDIIGRNTEAITRYGNAYVEYRKKQEMLGQLKAEIEQSRKEEDFIRFQYNELSNARLEAGQQETLETESKALSHSEEIKSALYEADSLLNAEDSGIVGKLRNVSQLLHSIEDVYAHAKDIAERIDEAHVELKDVAREVTSGVDDIDFNPERLNVVNERLDTIYALEQKFHVDTVEELIELEAGLRKRLDSIDNSDAELEALSEEVGKLYEACRGHAEVLTDRRRHAANEIEQDMIRRLVALGMPNVRFEIQICDKPLSSDGCDKVLFLFSANKNMPPQPISQVASGGEIARVMLSLKAMISGAVKLPTIIFDEIDTGVSGNIAQKMAAIMREMGRKDRQVISITHLPQIAALGATHYKVYKKDTENGTTSYLRVLNEDERIREIAGMLSGNDISEAAINNAKELLK